MMINTLRNAGTVVGHYETIILSTVNIFINGKLPNAKTGGMDIMSFILARPCDICKKDIELDEFLQHHTIKVDVYTNHTQTFVLCNSCFEPFREGGLFAIKEQEAIR